MADITFEIIENIATLKTLPSGWKKELNLVSWNGADPKYDIRDWDEDHNRMTRGITLRPDEMQTVVDVLSRRKI